MNERALYILAENRRAMCVLQLLEEAGFEAWFVGGCVRDALMGRPISDVDIATAAHWEDVERICGNAGLATHQTGIKHGTITVVVDGEAFEVTTYRTDSATSADARHPDTVLFVSTIDEDLSRRDFTMNALAWHPERGLLDPFCGIADIEAALIRTVGNPKRRFREDALRILRACRFASQLGFTIEPVTYQAMLINKSLLLRVSTERVTAELDRFLLGDHIHDALMATVDVLAVIIPELVAMKDCPQVTKYHVFDVLEHTAWALQAAVQTRLVRWAVLCHDMGKPACAFFDEDGVEHFYGHAKMSARIASGLLDRLLMAKRFKDDVLTLVSAHSDDYEANSRCIRRRLARMDGCEELLRALFAVNRADTLAHAPKYRAQTAHIDELETVLDAVLAEGSALSVRDLAIGGADVMALGVAPGPVVGQLLDAALDAVIDEAIPNEQTALVSFVRERI